MILADTSAWVEFDRATGSSVDLRVTDLIGTGQDLAVTEPVVMEVVAGARDEARASQLRRLLLAPVLLPFEPTVDFASASTIHQRCRRAGVTPRGLLDCLIAAVAWRHGASVLAQDVDLARIAEVLGIELEPASLRP